LLEEDGGEDIDAAVVLLLAKVWLVLHKNKREKTQMSCFSLNNDNA